LIFDFILQVLLTTSVGDIDIELWCKETPKACRNFIQLCIEGYYDETIFHRVVKGFIVQGGDPTGTGLGGESVYGEPFKDEFHSRLRFERRGLVAMANAGKDDNLSQFFFTMGPALELQNKHTIFGKVTGSTVYNMLKLQEAIVDNNERPEYPHKILKAEVLRNPFEDIVPRQISHQKESTGQTDKDGKSKAKSKSRATKDFKLLSFGDEAEEEEEEIDLVVRQELKGKSKSLHDLLTNDSKLSSKSAADLYPQSKEVESILTDKSKPANAFNETRKEAIASTEKSRSFVVSDADESSDSNDMYHDEKKKMKAAQKQLKELKRELKTDQQLKEQVKQDEQATKTAREEKRQGLKDLLGEYKSVPKFVRKTGEQREQEVSSLCKHFCTFCSLCVLKLTCSWFLFCSTGFANVVQVQK
jgi:peptidyl-prolyl cis-trans isomerase SDCCAG10